MNKALLSIVTLILITGCGSFGKKLKAFLGGKPMEQATAQQPAARTPSNIRFSDTPNHLAGPRRQYKRVTKKTLEDEAFLNSGTGSLWVMEGQGAYLFSQNVVRMIGDPVPVRIEGDSKDQLQTKAGVIRKLLDQLDARAKAQALARQRRPAGAPPTADAKGKDDGDKEKANKGSAAAAQKSTKPQDDFNVNNVTTRVVERTVDGNYRVKGSQPFMIGNREYKVNVTGIVRAEDFNEDGISSKDLLDPNFDIVGVRRDM